MSTYRDPDYLVSRLWFNVDGLSIEDHEDFIRSVHSETVLVAPSGGDDSVNILKARDNVLDGGITRLTPGNFSVSENISLPDNVSFVGSGASTLITFTAAFDIGIGNTDSVGGNSNIYVGNLRLDGADLCNDPIEFNNVTDGIVENVWVRRGNHDGVELQSCSRCVVSMVIASESNTFSGIELDGSRNCIVADCIVHSNNTAGLEFDGVSLNNVVTSLVTRDNNHGVIFGANAVDNFVTLSPESNTSAAVLDNSSGANGWLNLNSGNMGINSQDPQVGLVVHEGGSGNAYAQFTNDDTGGGATDGLTVGYDGTGQQGIVWLRENKRLKFAANNAEVFRLDGTYMIQKANDAAVADFNLPTGFGAFYIDETGNNLHFKVKYADGTTIKTATVALV